MPEFAYTDLLPLGADTTQYRLLTADGVTRREAFGREFLEVDPGVLTLLAREGMRDIAHLLRPGHLRQLRSILDDPEASPNDRYVARDLLTNACIAAGGVLPMCQDTGTAIIMGKRGGGVLTDGRDEEHLARGVFDAYTQLNLRYSQLAPLTMWDERNTGSQPARPDRAVRGAGRGVQVPADGQGRRVGQQVVPVPADQGGAERGQHARLPDREDRLAGHGRLPAVPPGDRGRRHQRRVRAQDRQVRLGPLPGHAAGRRLTHRPRLPRPGPGAAGAGDHPQDRHRRAVRRQVLLPRRAGDPAAPARRVLPGRDRGLLLRRPPGAGQDHRRRGVPGATGDRSGAIPAGDHRRGSRRRRGADRPDAGR